MNYLFKILIGLLGLFVVAATLYGLFLIGGLPLIVLVLGCAALAYYLWRRIY